MKEFKLCKDNCIFCEDKCTECANRVYECYLKQEAEIKRLKTDNLILSQKRINMFERLEIVNTARAEAIQGFADRLKENKIRLYGKYIVLVDDIDKLLKEMGGGE